MTRIDAATGEVLGTTDVAATGTHLAVGAGGAWVESWLSSHSDLASGASDQLVALRLSPETGEVQGSPITVEGSFSPFGFDSEGVWFFGENSQGDGFALSRLNSQSLRVDGHIDLEYEPTDAALDVERHTVWVANYQGSVSRITLDT